MNENIIKITKIITFEKEKLWYKFDLNGLTFYIIPKNKHQFNTVLIRANSNDNYKHLVDSDLLDLSILRDYHLQTINDIIFKIASFDFKDKKECYEISKLKSIIISSNIEIEPMDLNNLDRINEARINLSSYDNFLKQFKDILENPLSEKDIEEFIINNKNKIPFFKINGNQISMVNEWGEERKFDITFQKFMNTTSDILELKKSTLRVLNKFGDGKSNDKIRFYWSIDTTRAISQVEEYINLANKTSNSQKEKFYCHTKAIILIGRKYDGETNQKLKKKWTTKFDSLNKTLENITIFTYDDFYELLEDIRNSFK